MAYTSIDDPEAHFRIKLYAGNGSHDRAIVFDTTDTTMQPNLVWLKNRSSNSTNHAVMGTGLNTGEYIRTNADNAETSGADVLNSIDSNGFEIGSAGAIQNDSGDNYVAWCWKESATAGFDIVTYTGNGSVRTISHSLSAVPHLMIQKKLSGSAAWTVYHHKMASDPETDYLYLSTTAAVADYNLHWNDTAPTSSVFTLGTDTSVNGSSATNVMYLFTAKQGFSKFGSFESNGNINGSFCWLGFRPAMVITKSIDSTSSWQIFDNKREGYNVDNDALVVEATTAEVTTDYIDLLSNGFKVRSTSDPGVAETYIYMAFAEAPFVNSKGVPNNAR